METDLPTIAKAIRALNRRDLEAWFKRGELLSQAQRLCSGDRHFATWLRDTGTPKKTAYRAIAAWRDFGSVPSRHRFTREAMELLSRCEAARSEALDLPAAHRVTARIARSLLAKHNAIGLPSLPKLTTPPLPQANTRVIIGEGYKIVVTLDEPITPAGLTGALANASSVIRNEMLLRRGA